MALLGGVRGSEGRACHVLITLRPSGRSLLLQQVSVLHAQPLRHPLHAFSVMFLLCVKSGKVPVGELS